MQQGNSNRSVVVFAHTGREDAMHVAFQVCQQLEESGIIALINPDDLAGLQEYFGAKRFPAQAVDSAGLQGVELALVLGGDGTILRAAEEVRAYDIPLLGVNLGHVGFLAESDRADLRQTVEWVVQREYSVEERMTIDVTLWVDGTKAAHTWALNEVSVEKSDRERMLEVVTEVDGRPLSAFGGDGVVMATPTGSTAYAFSAGGPVVWPEVDALLMVPISAHALFAKPLVVSPRSTLAVEVLERADAHGIMWCDGRRSWPLPPGSRIEVTRSTTPVRLARVHRVPFSARLVRKFALPVQGWRGPANDRSEHAGTVPIPVVRPKPRGPVPPATDSADEEPE